MATKTTEPAEQNAPVVADEPQQDAPGGRYLVNGTLVDANGKPLKGKAEDGE